MEQITTQASRRDHQADSLLWYAMRVTYRRELAIQQELTLQGITSFVPMATRHERKGRRILHITEPAIHSLIFVYAQETQIQEFKRTRPALQYIMTREGTTSHKTIVPQKQMEDFISVCQNSDERLQIVPAEELHLTPGQKVRITDGSLTGMEGTFQRVGGSRNRRFIVTIPGIAAAITANVSATQITPV